MKTLAYGAFALSMMAAGAVSAQTQPAQQPITHGAPVAGVCVLNLEAVIRASTAGQGVAARMQALQQEVAAELAPYQATIQQEDAALAQGGASIPADQRAQRARDLQARFTEYQQLGQTRERELQYTASLQQRALFSAADPIIASTYQSRGCSVLLDRSSVYLSNPAMDISETVLQQLNSQVPSLPSFNRTPVPVEQPQQ
ncbi:OmpH family outer membrane protein [Brevundimonas sp.]|uniref:OmpH family outer membrane protein n=1 Tax=Brevundimonas sp. TaxID=1871086 RepID=UPI002D28E185|nr:OmpH family outer membrane protein [Brevundimonas sp.]HYC68773.1 OmpH family outer membrane protein [Brevundimonas sp.]